MKIAFIALLSVLTLTPVCSQAASSQDERAMANTGVVLLQGYTAQGLHAIGAGAIIQETSDGNEITFLTAAHVAALSKLSVTFADGATGIVRNVLPAPDGSDLALVTAIIQPDLDSMLPNHLNYHVYSVSDAATNTGDNLTIVGHPDGALWTVSQGVVSDVRTAPMGSHIMASSAVYRDFTFTCAGCREGDSGGPVLNRAGQIVGIMVGSFRRDGVTYEVCAQRDNFTTLLVEAK